MLLHKPGLKNVTAYSVYRIVTLNFTIFVTLKKKTPNHNQLSASYST